MLPYALAIFTGAFLLFQVQPLIGKFILPWFGGSPGVWTTCLLFFQVLLLGGYAYAHVVSSRLRMRQQVVVHLALIGLALVLLPITPSESWKHADAANPTVHILLLLTASIGLPYFVLSGTGPLVQHWFSRANPGVSPYRLYALSNIGSLLALLSYPFYFEPRWTRQEQASGWAIGLVIYGVVCALCAFHLFRRRDAAGADPTAATSAEDGAGGSPVPPRDRILWLVFPALASVLLLATTNKLCQDVAVVPFLWVLPLALYLLTFILCFDHPRWYARGLFTALFVLFGSVVGVLLMETTGIKLPYQVFGYSAGLFVACMICHGELYRLKPPAAYLTKYYLYISAGGALGGLLVAVAAPAIFNHYVELQIGLGLLMYLLGTMCILHQSRSIALGAAAGTLLALIAVPALYATKIVGTHGWRRALVAEFKVFYEMYGWWAAAVVLLVFWGLIGRGRWWPREWQLRMAAGPMVLAFVAGVFFVVQIGDESGRNVEASRNFYGTLTVMERKREDERLRYYALTHGNITHGLQFAEAPLNRLITSYYGESSGVGRAIASVPSLGGKRIGVVGLGTGTLATYGEVGDRLRFYEINPAVEDLARTRFTFLNDCKGDVSVVLGDARLSLEREMDAGELQSFDVLALDAFSSDAIPVHLLTKEAFELYLMHMAWGGIIAVHTSNRFLSLEPAVYRVAEELGLKVVTVSDNPHTDDWWLYRSTWLLVSRSEETLMAERIVAGSSSSPKTATQVRLWTDDYASIFPLLR